MIILFLDRVKARHLRRLWLLMAVYGLLMAVRSPWRSECRLWPLVGCLWPFDNNNVHQKQGLKIMLPDVCCLLLEIDLQWLHCVSLQ